MNVYIGMLFKSYIMIRYANDRESRRSSDRTVAPCPHVDYIVELKSDTTHKRTRPRYVTIIAKSEWNDINIEITINHSGRSEWKVQ